MKRTLAILVILLSLLTSCNRLDFNYPQSKIWAHRVNDTAAAREKSMKFAGLEVDVFYSAYQDKIFVGHNMEDTANGLQIEKWFKHVENPSHKCFWIDMKNLDRHNAKKISEKLLDIMDSYNMIDNMFVESTDLDALKTIKKLGLRTILWTDNPVWNNIDTATWIEHTRTKINELRPDAISNEAEMYELLTVNFPEQNIHLWQTPTILNEENIEITRKLCRNTSVKVVLVDYNEPIDYK
ncbi:MAG: hypothetical protein J6W06_03335 [Bacteroidales bacterium]|nr:hypothetical protein [Bacteroidales bacterium]